MCLTVPSVPGLPGTGGVKLGRIARMVLRRNFRAQERQRV
jgi:hypothetical protein